MSNLGRSLALLALGAASAGALRAQTTLFYLELQAVAAYSSATAKIEPFSLAEEETMQRPSLGFDFVKRFSGKTGDFAILSVQARLASDTEGNDNVEPQLFNAFIRFKARFADLWIGHERPALGLSSVVDSHPLLLPVPAMLGFGFDRDWGVGLRRDFAWGDAAASLTLGSGMALIANGNYLAAARVSKGVLTRDNYNVGLSLAHGRILDTMGTTLLDEEPFGWTIASLDASYLWRNLENRAEVLVGRRAGAGTVMVFWRSGLALLDEGRLKVELQPVATRTAGAWGYALGSGLTYLLNADLAGRFMVYYDHGRRDTRYVFQVYYYKRL